ncbi:carbohydrate esterase family 16 [Lecanosticta acicola]|uniref:Carbohydrate esterase family 16 n=1 Tax=Lecanosticta acicola TaxID=111012 RepID=A0AAI8YWB6_9PEZI|nr:carbohydrate esterase family 16 [Lecanosticta acicola]
MLWTIGILPAAVAFAHAAPAVQKTNGHSSDLGPSYGGNWPGWSGITHMFVFGDSYTTTGFEVNETQPSEVNPLGNPTYPGYTSSNGPNWVDFLTTTWNKTLVETVNLAYGGATVDAALIPQYLPTVLSLKQQVDGEYGPTYASRPGFFPWQPENTLFAVWIGINDINNAYHWANKSEVFDLDIKEYAGLVDTLYCNGARNFLFLNVPPIDRSPSTITNGASSPSIQRTDISEWNRNVSRIASNLSSTYQDATTFVFDTNKLFNQVLDDPCSYEATCAYKDTSDYCASYENGTPSWYTKYDNCTFAVDEYFWLNDLHPTFRVHNITAEEIARRLSA